MKNTKPIFVCVFLIALIVMLPVCFADEIRATEGVTLTKKTGSTKDQKNSEDASAQSASAGYNFPGLPMWLILLIVPYVTYIAIGATVIAAGYVVYRVGYSIWTYYNAYSYSKWYNHHSYTKHIVNKYEFENIWGKTKPTRNQFEDKCKKTINSKSSSILKFIQRSNGRFIAYDTLTKMIVVGETDGKTIVTCYKDTTGELERNTGGSSPNWIKFK